MSQETNSYHNPENPRDGDPADAAQLAQTAAPPVTDEDETDTSSLDTSAASEPAEGAAAPSTLFGAQDPVGEPTADMPLKQVIEALLFASDVPISVGKLAETVGLDSTKPVKEVVAELNADYDARKAAYRVEERAGGYQLLTLPQYADFIQRLVRKKDEGRLTPAGLETLAIVAYKQPIIRADIEAIRGVSCGEVLRSLMEHNLIKIVGRAEVVGRPMLYGTTRYFLEIFGLANIKDLPKAESLKEPK